MSSRSSSSRPSSSKPSSPPSSSSSTRRIHNSSRPKKAPPSPSSEPPSSPPNVPLNGAPFSDDESPSTASDHIPQSSSTADRLRRNMKRSAPIPIPQRRRVVTPPMSYSMTESLAAAKAELDPKNKPPGTTHPLIVMPGGDFVPPHILAERERGPPPMARSYPGKQRFRDYGNPPDWFY